MPLSPSRLLWLPLLAAPSCTAADVPGGSETDDEQALTTQGEPTRQGTRTLTLGPTKSPDTRVPADPPPTGDLIVAIVLDTARKDRMGRLGNAADPNYNPLPFLDSLWEQGLLLDNHHSCSDWTLSSMACAFTGQGQTSLDYFGPHNGPERLSVDIPWWPSELLEKGYATHGVLANSILDRRLDHGYSDLTFTGERTDAGLVVDMATERLTRCRPDEDCFLHVHFMDPHLPWEPPDAFLTDLGAPPPGWEEFALDLENPSLDLGQDLDPDEVAGVTAHANAIYNATLRYMDQELQRLWQALPAHATVLLFTDHGEQLGEHGTWTHGQSLHEEELASVAAFFGPDITPGVMQQPTSHEDLLPTLAALRGEPAWPSWTGVPAGTRVDPVQAWQCLSETGACLYLGAIIDDAGRKVLTEEQEDGESTATAYDLPTDVGELRDVFQSTADDWPERLLGELQDGHPASQ